MSDINNKKDQTSTSSRWQIILLGLLLLICFICLGSFIFENNQAGSQGMHSFPVSLKSILTPDYNQDKQGYLFPAAGIGLLQSALQDQGLSTLTSIPMITQILQTPVPSVTSVYTMTGTLPLETPSRTLPPYVPSPTVTRGWAINATPTRTATIPPGVTLTIKPTNTISQTPNLNVTPTVGNSTPTVEVLPTHTNAPTATPGGYPVKTLPTEVPTSYP